MDWIKDVRYILMPSNAPVKGYEREYALAYETWKRAWEKFRSELGATEDKLHSDGFLGPQEMGVLFYKNECVGFSSFTPGNLDDGPFADHSWWKTWSPEALEKLRNISPNVMFGSQFTVNPDFAGKGHIVRWKDVLSLCVAMRILNHDLGIMVGILNLTRGMQNVGDENHGGIVIDSKVQFNFFGKPVDAMLVAYVKENLVKMLQQRELTRLAHGLWSKHEFADGRPQIKPLKIAA